MSVARDARTEQNSHQSIGTSFWWMLSCECCRVRTRSLSNTLRYVRLQFSFISSLPRRCFVWQQSSTNSHARIAWVDFFYFTSFPFSRFAFFFLFVFVARHCRATVFVDWMKNRNRTLEIFEFQDVSQLDSSWIFLLHFDRTRNSGKEKRYFCIEWIACARHVFACVSFYVFHHHLETGKDFFIRFKSTEEKARPHARYSHFVSPISVFVFISFRHFSLTQLQSHAISDRIDSKIFFVSFYFWRLFVRRNKVTRIFLLFMHYVKLTHFDMLS